jgi:DNA polymerase V
MPVQSKIIALADANNFFASCEKVFNPALADRPVVVLSGNDACVVSRSPEAKALGIKMQALGTSLKHMVHTHNLCILSTNPPLYRDMSQRVMQTLAHFCPDVEVYSVDEAFLDLSGFSDRNLNEYAQQIRTTVKQWTGISVSIGIATTKTLAKIANHMAKADPSSSGVTDISVLSKSEIDAILGNVEVREVWGVGRNIAEALHGKGIWTALQLKQANPDWVRKRFNVVSLRTVLELGGMSCLPVENTTDAQKGMMVTRCFGRPVTGLGEMKEAIATHVSRLAEKLRKEGLVTPIIVVSFRTNRYADSPQYGANQEVRFPVPTNSTQAMLQPALDAVTAIFRHGYQYYKAGVYAPELVDANAIQGTLFDAPEDSAKSQRLMQALDGINRKLGSGSLQFGAVGLKQEWKSRLAYPSKRYTTDWAELPIVKA